MRKNKKDAEPSFSIMANKNPIKMAIFHIPLMSNADYGKKFHLNGKSNHFKNRELVTSRVLIFSSKEKICHHNSMKKCSIICNM